MNSLQYLYDPLLFEKVANCLTEELGSYLKKIQTTSVNTLNYQPPKEMIQEVSNLLSTAHTKNLGEDSAEEITTRIRILAQNCLKGSTHLQSPYYMGHQLVPPIPIAAALNLLGGILNPGLAVYELSGFCTAIERSLISKLGSYIGWSSNEFDGIVTNGGSLANVTALLAARSSKFPQSWENGMGNRKPAILTNSHSHYSISRAAGILGFGTDQVISVPIDHEYRMDAHRLEECYQQARQKGYEVFCLVGSACTTPTGAFDPLEELGTFAAAKNIWFHVDAAHGGSLLLSKRYRHLLKGVERADSVIWDAHKMMFVPSLCTFLFYRERAKSFLPFHQQASYLFDENQDAALYNGGLRTFECTKGPIALPVWFLWATFGSEVFVELIEKVIDTTNIFHNLLMESQDFIPLHKPECNILCFRYAPHKFRNSSAEEISIFQQKIRNRILRNGKFYISGTMIDGVYSLRVTVINPLTERKHILELLEEIRSIQI